MPCLLAFSICVAMFGALHVSQVKCHGHDHKEFNVRQSGNRCQAGQQCIRFQDCPRRTNSGEQRIVYIGCNSDIDHHMVCCDVDSVSSHTTLPDLSNLDPSILEFLRNLLLRLPPPNERRQNQDGGGLHIHAQHPHLLHLHRPEPSAHFHPPRQRQQPMTRFSLSQQTQSFSSAPQVSPHSHREQRPIIFNTPQIHDQHSLKPQNDHWHPDHSQQPHSLFGRLPPPANDHHQISMNMQHQFIPNPHLHHHHHQKNVDIHKNHQQLQHVHPESAHVHLREHHEVERFQTANGNQERKDECGIPGSTFSKETGSETNPGEFPWLASLQYKIINTTTKEPMGEGWLCGGSLVHKDYILTAAHCVDDGALAAAGSHLGITYEPIMVRLGEHNFFSSPDCSDSPDCPERQDFSLLKGNIVIHPQYKRETNSSDIALIKIKSSDSQHFLSPVCLPATAEATEFLFNERSTPYVAGWGISNMVHGVSNKSLMKTTIQFSERSLCLDYQTKQGMHLSDDQMCFTGRDHHGLCIGDAGGPVFITRSLEFPKFIQVGLITHVSLVCEDPTSPGIYTDIARHLDWIYSYIGEPVSGPGRFPNRVKVAF